MRQGYEQLELPFEEDLRTPAEVVEDAVMDGLMSGKMTVNLGGLELGIDYTGRS